MKYLSAIVFMLYGCSPAWADASGDLMQRNFMASKVSGATYRTSIRLIDADNGIRTRETDGTTKLQANGIDNMRLTTFLSPADVKGTATLLIEHAGKTDDMWIYLPNLKKVRRLAANNKRDGFMGTDLSFGDVIGFNPVEWRHRVLGTAVIDGTSCTQVESVPNDDRIQQQSGYSKRVSCIDEQSGVSLRVECWDENSQPLKTIRQKEIKSVDAGANRWQPMQINVINQQTGHRTEIRLQDYRLTPNIDAEKFRAQSLEGGL